MEPTKSGIGPLTSRQFVESVSILRKFGPYMNRVGSLQVYSKNYITRSLEVIDTHYWQVVYIPVTGR